MFKPCGHVKFIILLAAVLLFSGRSVCLGDEPIQEPCAQPLAEPDFSANGSSGGSDDADWLVTLKGQKARDALLIGMWSLHLDGSGESTGSGNNNEENHLFGVQYYGLTAGTFINSHHKRSFYGGVAREVWSCQYTPDVRLDLGYKAGLMTGYQEKFPDFQGVIPFITGFFGASWKRMGVDLGVTPLGVFTLNFRVDIDRIFDAP